MAINTIFEDLFSIWREKFKKRRLHLEKGKIQYMQGVRTFACISVFVTHFISVYLSNFGYFLFYGNFGWVVSFLKSSVATTAFCVLGGYFAYRSFISGPSSLVVYTFKRYIRFMPMALLANMLYFFVNPLLANNIYAVYKEGIPWYEYIISGLLLNDQINSSFWALMPLFLGPILVAACTKWFQDKRQRFIIMGFITLISMVMGIRNFLCVTAAFGGVLLYELELLLSKTSFNKNKVWPFFALLCAFALCVVPENNNMQIFRIGYAVAVVLFLLALPRIQFLNRLFSCRPVLVLGNVSYEFYGLHLMAIFIIPFAFMLAFTNGTASTLLLWGFCVVTFFITLAVALLVHKFLQKLYKFVLAHTTCYLKRLVDWARNGFVKNGRLGHKYPGEGYTPLFFLMVLLIVLFFLIVYVYRSSAKINGFLGSYALDYWAHTGVASRLFGGPASEPNPFFQIIYTYPLFHFFTKMISLLSGLSIEISAGFTIALFVSFTILLVRYFFSLACRTAKQQYLADFLSIASVFFLNVYIPDFVSTVYLPQGNPNLWHNPTFLVARPFSMLTLWFFIKMFEQRNENYKRYLLLFAAASFVGTVAKPSYGIVFLPVAACFIVFAFIKSKGKTLRFSFACLLAVLPSVALMFYQLTWSRLSERAGNIFVAKFTPDVALKYLLLMIIFPLFVFLVKGFKKISPLYIMLWSCVLLGWAEYSCTNLGDFIWGYVMASYMLMAYSVYLLFFDNTQSASWQTKAIGGAIVSYQLGIGIFYFATGVLGSHLIY